MDIITTLFTKVLSLLLAVLSIIPYNMPARKVDADHSHDVTNYPFVLVHGFFGWGDYDKGNETMPYWGATDCSLVKSLRESGYTCSAASLAPCGSAWDRACELYAEMTGTRVDYGKVHSEKYGHDRYGEDYTGRPLVAKWDSENKVNFISHSFGGPTCSLFASILEYGWADEAEATTDGSLSDFFKGGKGDYIYSMTGIASPYNGTTLTLMTGSMPDTLYSLSKFALTKNAKRNLSYFENGNIAAPDTALFDMNPDNAAELNKSIKIVDGIYYFSVPCCMTKVSKVTGNSILNLDVTDTGEIATSLILGRIKTVTKGGIVIDEKWQPNDGEVNTYSATAPFNAKSKEINLVPCLESGKNGFETGVYNIMATHLGAHNCLTGNTSNKPEEALPYLVRVCEMVNSLAQSEALASE